MSKDLYKYHRFLDEAGDTTFYGKGKIPIIGNQGVSKTFILGMVKFNQPIVPIREEIKNICLEIENNNYFNTVPSVLKKISKGNFFFHAKDDIPELRKVFFDYILKIDCKIKVVVGRKVITRFEKKHNGKETEFYADLLSHLLKDEISNNEKLILNVAERSNSTAINNLQNGLEKAKKRFYNNYPNKDIVGSVIFCVHKYKKEPLLSVTDYLCWSVQRVFETGQTRFYDYIKDKIEFVIDLYDKEKFNNNLNIYTAQNPLSEKNKVSPQST